MSNPFTTTALLWTLPEIREMMASAQEHFQEYVAEQGSVERLKSAIGDFRHISDVLKVADASSASILAWELADLLELVYHAPEPPSSEVLEKLIEGTLQLSNVLHYLSGGHPEPTDLLLPLINDFRALRHARPYQPTALEVSSDIAKAFMRGRNQDVWKSVSDAIKEDLGNVKDNIDLFLRTGQVQLLLSQMPELERTSLVFSFLEIPSLQDRIEQQLGILSGIASSLSNRSLGDHEKNQLLDVASDLLIIDNELENHISLLLYNKDVDLNPEVSETLTKEIFISLARAKHLISEFDEKKLPTDTLNEVVKLFHEVSGALMILNLYDVLPLLDHIEEYLQKSIIDSNRCPERPQLQAFASAIVCVECFIEAIRDRNPYTNTILRYASGYLSELGIQWNVSDEAPQDETEISKEIISENGAVLETVIDVRPVFDEAAIPTPFDIELSESEPLEDQAPLLGVATLDAVNPSVPSFEQLGLSQELIDALGGGVEASPSSVADVSVESDTSDDLPEIDFSWVQTASPHQLSSSSSSLDLFVQDVTQGLDQSQESLEDTQEVDHLMKELEALCSTGTSTLSEGEGELLEIVPFDGDSTVTIDADMHEIFAEELQEEIISLEEWLPNFTPYMNDPDLLRNVRKSFHTIKGSGRMVGTKTLSEISWRIEAVLNTVVEGRQPVTPNIVCLVHTGKHIFSEFKNVLQGGQAYWNPELFYLWSDALLDGRDMASPFVAKQIPVTKLKEISAAPLLDMEDLSPPSLILTSVDLTPVEQEVFLSPPVEVQQQPHLSFDHLDEKDQQHIFDETSSDLIKKAHLSPEHIPLVSHGMLDVTHDIPLEDHAHIDLHQPIPATPHEEVEDLDALWKSTRPDVSLDVDLTPTFVAPPITGPALSESVIIPDMELSLLSPDEEHFDVPASKAPVIPEHLSHALSQWNLESNDDAEKTAPPAWATAPAARPQLPVPAPTDDDLVQAQTPAATQPTASVVERPAPPSPLPPALHIPMETIADPASEEVASNVSLPTLPVHNSSATDWKVHLHHLYDLNALMYSASQEWDGQSPEQFKSWLEDLWQQKQWTINSLRDTCLDNEKKARDAFKEKEARLTAMIQQSQKPTSPSPEPKERPKSKSAAPVFEPPTLPASSDDDTYISTNHVETITQTQALTSPPLIPAPRKKPKGLWKRLLSMVGLGNKKSK